MLAEKEIADAQCQLGNCFYNGIGTKIDKVQARCWYEKATKNGNIIAKDNLKKYYNKKMKIEVNKFKTNKHQKRLNFKELGQIGLNFFVTKFTKNNQEKTFNYIQQSKGNKYKMVPFDFKNCYKKDKGVRKNGKKGFEFHLNSADQGNMDAKFQLGYCYDEGIGTDINKVTAFELYKKGIGTEVNEKKAFELVKNLAKKEYLNALLRLGYYYDEGIGTEINKSKAFELYKIAAEKDHIIAQYNLREGVDKDEKKAFELMKDLAEKGYLDAQFQLGYYYDEGIETEINKSKAFELYKIQKKNV
ncbi:hypothetical protein C1645_876308 [Glomus cerebriforme]|uniref:Sel1 repeat protein n=1 Tax=Glomus cerebriforme TaxID=658196 RepID=A0A397SVP2_9GLOM|nr:hypothetical protein C1645_876308 [Glomus cerebriforme]